jgi:biopolymer transport protein ExbD
MKIALRSHHSTLAELNLTPLLDLVFVLLVIFIITTPQLTNNLELALPSSKADAPKREPVHIRVAGRNLIQLDSRNLTFAEFKTELAGRRAAQPDLAVIVEGTDRAEYQAVVDVLEAIQQLNITEVGLATMGEALQKP